MIYAYVQYGSSLSIDIGVSERSHHRPLIWRPGVNCHLSSMPFLLWHALTHFLDPKKSSPSIGSWKNPDYINYIYINVFNVWLYVCMSMYVCILYVYIYICVCVCICIYTYIHTYIHMCVCFPWGPHTPQITMVSGEVVLVTLTQ